jgi:hypothetical protein
MELPPCYSTGLRFKRFSLPAANRCTPAWQWDGRALNMGADGRMVKGLGKTHEAGALGDSQRFHAVSSSADCLWLAAADMGGLIHVWSIPRGA